MKYTKRTLGNDCILALKMMGVMLGVVACRQSLTREVTNRKEEGRKLL